MKIQKETLKNLNPLQNQAQETCCAGSMRRSIYLEMTSPKKPNAGFLLVDECIIGLTVIRCRTERDKPLGDAIQTHVCVCVCVYVSVSLY